jgi:hypothetical protein
MQVVRSMPITGRARQPVATQAPPTTANAASNSILKNILASSSSSNAAPKSKSQVLNLKDGPITVGATKPKRPSKRKQTEKGGDGSAPPAKKPAIGSLPSSSATAPKPTAPASVSTSQSATQSSDSNTNPVMSRMV